MSLRFQQQFQYLLQIHLLQFLSYHQEYQHLIHQYLNIEENRLGYFDHNLFFLEICSNTQLIYQK